jgi:tetratricopeptide (TPR) repeat protein
VLATSLPALADTGTRTDAKAHFQRGVSLFERRRFAEALDEFERAYQLQPAAPVLYNIGQVDVALGKPVEAVAAFERYLADGGDTIPDARRADVRAEIERQSAKIGELALLASESGAEVRVDGRVVGTTPFARPLRIAAGVHSVQVLRDGFKPFSRDVEVLGGTAARVDAALVPIAPAPAPVPVAPPAPAPAPVPVAAPPPPLPAAPPAPAPPAAPPARASSHDTVGWVVAGAGLVATGAGVVAYLAGTGARDGAADDARRAAAAGDRAAYDSASSAFSSAKTTQVVGAAVGGVGVAALGVGAVMLLSSGEGTSAGATVAPWAVAGGGGVTWRSAW